MNSHQVVRRLEAFRVGRPLPRGETIHLPISGPSDILLLAFVRMGGESAPWGIAFGNPEKAPTVLAVPEPRNRDLVAGMAAALAPVLLRHLRHPEHSDELIEGPTGERSLRQVWLPNRTHLDMLHHLAYAYTFTRWGEPGRARLLNQLGRAANFLFQEAHRPGQVTVLTGTDALRESFTFPTEDIRQSHLGFLLAWLTTPGSRDARLRAAAVAERLSVATSLDPELEHRILEPLVTSWNAARGNDLAQTPHARGIHEALTPELIRRMQLTQEAMNCLQAGGRRVNAGLDELAVMAQSEHWYRYLRLEKRLDDQADGPAFVPSPETDRHPSAAAARFFAHEEAEEIWYNALIHDDTEIQADAIAAGDAFRGKIVQVWDDGGRGSIPVWRVEDLGAGPIRLREGSWVCVAGVPKRTGTIRRVEPTVNGGRQFEIEITGWKRANAVAGWPVPAATASAELEGREVVMVEAASGGLRRRKGQRIWNRDVPGAWLTHGVPRGAAAQLPDDVGEDLDSIAVVAGGG